MLSRVEHRIKSGLARHLHLKSAPEVLLNYALSRSVQDRTTEKPAFNFDFFVGGFDGLSFAAPDKWVVRASIVYSLQTGRAARSRRRKPLHVWKCSCGTLWPAAAL